MHIPFDIALSQDCFCRHAFDYQEAWRKQHPDVFDDPPPQPGCPDCFGTGRTPTPFGQEILEFMDEFGTFIQKQKAAQQR